MASGPQISRLDVRVYCVPTDADEADCTFEWTLTTMVLVSIGSELQGILCCYSKVAFSQLRAEKGEPIHTAEVPKHRLGEATFGL